MLAIAIKNTILVILIMLIIHFFIKNILIDPPKEKFTPANFVMKPEGNDICIGKRLDDIEKKNLEDLEMKKYIGFADDKSLDNFFKDNALSEEVKELEACKLKSDNNQLPLSTTCNANITSVGHDDASLKIKKECDLTQDKKNVMLIKEYEDEKPINGGTLFDGLSAYDTLDQNYVPY